jgi:hypothetical protein
LGLSAEALGVRLNCRTTIETSVSRWIAGISSRYVR